MKNIAILSLVSLGIAAAFLWYTNGSGQAAPSFALNPDARIRLAEAPQRVPEGDVAGVADEQQSTGPEEVLVPGSTGQTVVGVSEEPTSISATADGFVPHTVTIAAGAAVVWKNSSRAQVYIAPDEYPSNVKYSGIWDDVGAGRIAPGETYTFIFSTPGIYTYHNQLAPDGTGTIMVIAQE